MWTFGVGKVCLCRLKCVCFVSWFMKEHGWIKCNGLPTPLTFRYIYISLSSSGLKRNVIKIMVIYWTVLSDEQMSNG